MKRFAQHFCIASAIFFMLNAVNASAQKNHRIVLQNGDYLTGEIKKLEFGKLSFKTDDMGTLSIEWDKIAELTAPAYFEVELYDGTLYFGRLGATSSTYRTAVIGDSTTMELYRFSIVRVTPIEDRFWARVDAALSLGLSYTKASQIGQFNVSADASYRGRIYTSRVSLSSVITSQQDTSTTQRHDFNFQGARFLGRRWFVISDLGMQRNTELGLDLRLLLDAGAGRSLIQTNAERLSLGGGLAINREWTAGATESVNNLELLGITQFSKFRYDNPQLNLSTKLNVYANLTTLGRVRVEFSTELRWEIVKDLFWNLSLYDSFDSMPPSGGAKNDWGLVISFGYSF